MLVLLLCFLTFASPFVSYVPSVAFSAPGGKNNLCSAAAHYTGANERQRIMFVQRDEGANAPSWEVSLIFDLSLICGFLYMELKKNRWKFQQHH